MTLNYLFYFRGVFGCDLLDMAGIFIYDKLLFCFIFDWLIILIDCLINEFFVFNGFICCYLLLCKSYLLLFLLIDYSWVDEDGLL